MTPSSHQQPRRVRSALLRASAVLLAIALADSTRSPANADAGGGGGGMSGGYSSPQSSGPERPKGPTGTSAYRRALKLIDKGDFAGGIEKLDGLLKDAPTDPDVLNMLGFAHRKLEHNDQSLDFYQRALAQDPSHLGANEYLGELYLQMGNFAQAEGQRKKLQVLCPAGCKELQNIDAAIAAFKAGGSTPKPGAS